MIKHIFFTFSFIAVLSFFAFSQQEKDLISRFRPGVMWFYTGVKPAQLEKVRKYDRLIVDLVYNDWKGKSVQAFRNNIGSIGFNTSFMFDIPLNTKNNVSVGVGLSYGLYKINHNDFFVRNIDSNITSMVKDIHQYGIEKSVFKAHSFSVPVELRFRKQDWKHFKIHIGGKVSYQFLSTTVLSSGSKGITSKQKTNGFYDFNPLNVSAHIRFGIRNWGLFASYHFLPFFTSSKSVQITGFQFGLSVSLF